MQLYTLLFAGLCIVGGSQAQAGLFTDDEAHSQIQQLKTQFSQLEESTKQQTRSLLDLQTQIEALNAELRKLRGQNEELVYTLQDTEKRQRDFYVDLDTRLRHIETVETPVIVEGDEGVVADDDPALQNRAYEKAYNLFKSGSYQQAVTAFQEFLKKFPAAVYVPTVHYEMASAYFSLSDFKNALSSYQVLVSKYPFSSRVVDAMFGTADSQIALNDKTAAAKTLRQIVAKYPGSESADKARKRLAELK